MSQARAEIEWDGHRVVVPGVEVEVIEDSDVLSDMPPAMPSYTFDVPLGLNMRRWLAQGHSVATMVVRLYASDGSLVSSSPVQQAELRDAPRHSTLTCQDRPVSDGSTIPASREILQRTFDAEASERAREQLLYEMRNEVAAENVRRWGSGAGKRQPTPFALIVGPDESEYYTYNERSIGRTMPLVFGRPGRDGTPALQIWPFDDANRYALVAGPGMTPGTVTVHKLQANAAIESDTFDLEVQRDEFGREYAVVQLPIPTSPTPTDCSYTTDAEFFVSFDGTAHGYPGTADEVIRYLCAATRGVRIDHASIESAAPLLRRYQLDAAIDQPVDAWDVLTGQVMPLLPAALVGTPYGTGLAVVVTDVTPDELMGTLKEGVDLHPLDDGAYIERVDQRTTSVVLSYAPSAVSKGYSRTSIGGPDSDAEVAAAATQLGATTRAMSTAWVYDKATAQRIARERARFGALAFWPREYRILPAAHGRESPSPIRAGQWWVVQASDGTSHTALVQSVSRYGADARVRLRLT